MFYSWFINNCYVSGCGITGRDGVMGEIFDVLYKDYSEKEFKKFLSIYRNFIGVGERVWF